MANSSIIGVSHFGVCVSDIDQATRFYRDGLGFTVGEQMVLQDVCGNVMGLEDFELTTQYMSYGSSFIELLWYRYSTNPMKADRLRPMNHTGLTHIALSVTDIDAVAESVLRYGGKVFPETRGQLGTEAGIVELMYCSDPDYTRIELIKFPKTK
jgi:lactoylglutathione lyase